MQCKNRLLGACGVGQNGQRADVVERSAAEPAQRFRSPWETAPSFRIAGSTAALVSALAAGLPRDAVRLSVQVTHAQLQESGVALRARGADGPDISIMAERVIFALPPRLLESIVAFTPPLSPQMRARWEISTRIGPSAPAAADVRGLHLAGLLR